MTRESRGMADHLQDVQSELKYMHQRYDGKKKELETEDHLQKMSNRERVGHWFPHYDGNHVVSGALTCPNIIL